MSDEVPLSGLVAILALLLLLSAFFSGSETALMRLNRYRLRHKARDGHRGAQLAERLLQRPDRLIGLILLGNNLVNFTAVALVTVLALRTGGEPLVAIATLVFTIVVLIFSEAAPKTLAALHPERIAYPAAYVYYPLLIITYPFVWLVSAMSNGVLWVLGVRDNEAQLHSLSNEELRTVVYEAGSLISRKYRNMLINILDLEKVSVDDVMVPHNEILGIDLDEDLEEITDVIRNSEHTRLPVYRDNIDQVIGVLHLRQLANLTSTTKFTKEDIERLAAEPYFVPEGTPLSTQLVQFQKTKQRFALVVDEYGDIQGIATLEDILEEIVGEFTTAPSTDEDEIVKEQGDTFLVAGTINIRELNRSMTWALPTNGPKTLNGLILEHLENIPPPGTCLKINDYPIEIVSSDDNRVQLVRMHAPLTHHKI
ncbi:MAG: HlyC/CorC family transporter [Gammaproteobacteria bacterium]|nr:HlyC/CorC family transporter [Gammaproteobacteria bacterium]MDH4254445.1 HlyC/CorC family transporter [Gammaproteobacteria bacterium]MDH5309400.1 HlyC/CorC family transporter [Gammaproteobacteria bacterium]